MSRIRGRSVGNAGLMLAHRLQCWANIKAALGERHLSGGRSLLRTGQLARAFSRSADPPATTPCVLPLRHVGPQPVTGEVPTPYRAQIPTREK